MDLNDTFPPVGSASFVRTTVTSKSKGSSASRRSASAGEARQGTVMHTFRTLRHFNELQTSIHRAEIDYHAQVFVIGEDVEEKPLRKLQFSSAHMLRDFSHSVYDDIREVKNFRKTLLEERAKQRASQLLSNQNSLSRGSMTSRPGSPLHLTALQTSLQGASQGALQSSLSGLQGGMQGPGSLQVGMQGPGSPSSMVTLSAKVEPLTSAKAKLAKCSMSFDPLTPDNQCMISGFHGQRLNRETFGVLIRQGMHIVLSVKEVDSLFGTMDVSQDGTFDGKEFTRKFFNLGNSARREKYIGMQREPHKFQSSRRMSNQEKEGEKVERWEAERARNLHSSPEEADRVMERLRVSSLKWHHLGAIDPFRARGFEAYLTPHQFKQQILKSFEINLNKIEINSLIGRYKDPTQEGMYYIDGHKFLGHFKGTMHQEAWAAHTEEQVKYAEHRSRVRSSFFTRNTLSEPLGR